MNEFFIVILMSFLYSNFLLNLRLRLELKHIKYFKAILLMLTVVSLITFFKFLPNTDPWVLYLEIIALLLLLVFLTVNYVDEIKIIAKAIVSMKSNKTPRLIDNDLAVSLIQSVDYLSKRKIGALITVEREVRLTNIIENALMLNADISKELLTSIFMPSTPLHDGAVIIRDNKILCAKAYFPASNRTDLPMNYGTRHRAALGISEHSDAFTIVVSEETGKVSVTIEGKMEYNVSKEALNLYLENTLKIN